MVLNINIDNRFWVIILIDCWRKARNSIDNFQIIIRGKLRFIGVGVVLNLKTFILMCFFLSLKTKNNNSAFFKM